jgi:hypothetical protein
MNDNTHIEGYYFNFIDLIYMLSRICVTIEGVWINEWIYWPLIHTTLNYVQAITALSLIYTRYKSLQHPLSLFQPSAFTSLSWQRLLRVEILQLHALRFCLHNLPWRSLLNWLCPLFETFWHEPHRKQSFSIVALGLFATETCLPRRCVSTAAARTTENTVLLLLRVLPSDGRCLQNHHLAKGLYATI